MAKSVIFTMDIMIGVFLLLVISSAILLSTPEITYEISFQLNSIEARDVINVLSNTKAKSFIDTKSIKDLIENQTIKREDLNKTILDLIGSLWYSGNKTTASNIAREILENMTKKCISLQTENETIYSSCNFTSKSVSVAYALASGYEIGRPVSGYAARAWLTK